MCSLEAHLTQMYMNCYIAYMYYIIQQYNIIQLKINVVDC